MNISYIPASVKVKERSKLLAWFVFWESRTFKRTALVSQGQAQVQHTLPVVLVFGAWRRHLNKKKTHLSVDSFQIEPLLQLS